MASVTAMASMTTMASATAVASVTLHDADSGSRSRPTAIASARLPRLLGSRFRLPSPLSSLTGLMIGISAIVGQR